MRRSLPLLTLLLAAITFSACQAEPPRAQANAPAQAQAKPSYSPFVVHVHDGAPFHSISFKDVGLHTPDHESAALYEVVAESVSLELQQLDSPRLSSEVRYSHDITDPQNHLVCEGEHIYVDLWGSAQTARYGYSLWSGCGEEDNFAWREIEVTAARTREEALAQVSRQIVTDLRSALQTGCFTRSC